MVIRANGFLSGTRIELDEPVSGLADGSPVSVELRPRVLTEHEKHHLIDELCGVMAGDPSIAGVFAEIEQRRNGLRGRPVNFNEPS